MKNVFDIDSDKGTYDGAVFCTREVSLNTSKEIDEAYDIINNAEGLSQQSIVSMVVEIICMIIVFGCIRGIANAEVTVKEALGNAPYLFVIAGAAAVVWLVIFVMRKMKQKQSEVYLEENHVLEDLEHIMERASDELEIPEDSMKIDVLQEVYEMKRGRKVNIIKPKSLNLVMDMYVKGEMLCFFDAVQELSVEIKDIIYLEKIRKKIYFGEWNKQEGYKTTKYKKYKIKEYNEGLFIKEYYSVQIHSMWGQFEIRLPNYEEEAVRKIEEITGKRVLE